MKKYIHFDTIVRSVKYSEKEDNFKVTAEDFKAKKETEETFEYIVVAPGHFSIPNLPSFPGLDDFPGRVLHALDFKDANEFTGKRLLLVCNLFGIVLAIDTTLVLPFRLEQVFLLNTLLYNVTNMEAKAS